MKFRQIALALTIPFLAGTAFLAGHSTANGSGLPILQQESRTETIVNSHCYTSHQVTYTYYHWSKTVGWEAYPSPHTTVTNGETCH